LGCCQAGWRSNITARLLNSLVVIRKLRVFGTVYSGALPMDVTRTLLLGIYTGEWWLLWQLNKMGGTIYAIRTPHTVLYLGPYCVCLDV